MSTKKLAMLVIMDGYGIRNVVDGNAIANAKKPNLDKLFNKYPNTLIEASGEAVGLPDGQMGNSEVGHMNIGAGRVVFQSLTRVNIACRENKLLSMPAIDKAIKHAINNNSDLHIMGLMSDGGVHSHIDHIIYLMNEAKRAGVKNVYVHSFLDGRDVPPKSAKEFLAKLDEARIPGVELGVVSGRYYAMDRDKNYNRIQLAYDALVYGKGSELMYTDNAGKVRFRLINPTQCFGIYDDSLSSDLMYFVRMYKASDWDDSDLYNVDVYSDYDVKHYTMNGMSGFLTFVLEEPHYFGQCPANIFYLPDEKSIFDCIITLQDAANELVSAEIDDYQAFCDAYLTLMGVDAESDDIASMKENKIDPYNEDFRTGVVRHVLVRRAEKETMLVLITNTNAFHGRNNFVQSIRKKVPEITTIIQNIHLVLILAMKRL